MNTSSRFAVAIHILVMLALYRRNGFGPLKSGRMAESVDTNAVMIRRIMGSLQAAGLVASRPGPKGGFVLAVEASQISLRTVYDTVESGQLFHAHYGCPMEQCPVGKHIADVVDAVAKDAVTAVREKLEERTIEQLATTIADRSGLSEYIAKGMTSEEITEIFLSAQEARTD